METSTTRAWVAAMLLTIGLGANAQEPGFRLGDAAKPVSYEWHLAIDPNETTFGAQVRIEIEIQRATPVLWLNATELKVESAQVHQDGNRVEATATAVGEDHLRIEPRGGAGFAPGTATVTLRYRGPIEPVSTRGLFRQQEGGDWYVVSQFEAISARRAVPCFDEPGFKTPWRIAIDAPEGNQVVANTPEVMLSDVLDRKGWKRHDFATTKALPSYLIAFGVGPFDIVDGGTAGMNNTPLRYIAPKGRGAETRYARIATPRILELLEQYFGRPYPFEKLDAMVIPQAVGFGAMENAGLITYASSLLLATPREETGSFKRNYASVAAHEMGHMWFGDLVTLAWWDDIWLNEAFATWIAAKVLPQMRAEWDNGESVGYSRKRSMGADRLASARSIRNPVVVKTDIEGAFDGITYQKGSAVISMFERWFGEDKFRDGVRRFLAKHEYGSATSDDFMRAIGESAGKGEEPLRMFRAFVEQPGAPLVDLSMQCRGSAASLETSVARYRPIGSTAQDVTWITPVCFQFGRDGKTVDQCTELKNGAGRVALQPEGACPDWLVANPDGRSHYLPRYDAALSAKLRGRMEALPAGGAVALMLDADSLAQSGLMPIADAFAWAAVGLEHPSPIVRRYAAELVEKQRDAWLTPALARAKHDLAAGKIVPMATALGWEEKAADSDETKVLRAGLMPFAAEREEGAALRPEARRLALAWSADRNAVAASMVKPVLETAARFADPPTYEKLEARALSAQDLRERAYLLDALARVRDPALRERAMRLSVAESLRPRDALEFLDNAMDDEANRRATLDFVRAHYEPLEMKLPEHTMPYLITRAGGLCTREDREEFVSTFKDRAPKYEGGALRYRQALETLDLCVAAHPRDRSYN
jgi:alanyl aminopeptidase